MDKNSVFQFIKSQGVVPVVKLDNADDVIPVAEALNKGGLQIAEITFRTLCGQQALATAVKKFKNMLIGAGTVVNLAQARVAASFGAKFIVSPGLDIETALFCQKEGIAYIPGCVTPTEIMSAVNLGLNVIKFFPAETFGGLKTIKALSPVFPSAGFMPTGGVNADNLAEYLACDKVIACGGSWMVSDKLISQRAFDEIERLSREARSIVEK